jgi:hypothetical protein
MSFRNYVANSVPLYCKPASATLCVIPQLFVRTHGILTIEQVVGPLGIAQGIRLEWSLDTRFTTVTEFTFSSISAPRALNQ